MLGGPSGPMVFEVETMLAVALGRSWRRCGGDCAVLSRRSRCAGGFPSSAGAVPSPYVCDGPARPGASPSRHRCHARPPPGVIPTRASQHRRRSRSWGSRGGIVRYGQAMQRPTAPGVPHRTIALAVIGRACYLTAAVLLAAADRFSATVLLVSHPFAGLVIGWARLQRRAPRPGREPTAGRSRATNIDVISVDSIAATSASHVHATGTAGRWRTGSTSCWNRTAFSGHRRPSRRFRTSRASATV
jgi:hypothetical protein